MHLPLSEEVGTMAESGIVLLSKGKHAMSQRLNMQLLGHAVPRTCSTWRMMIL